jgi:putative Mg2+ transporter-C (MgtC) family protein
MEYLFFLGKLVLAIVLGGVIGWQRQRIHRPAGIRTYALVTMGSALFTILSVSAFNVAVPSRVASQILTGIGFLGAGMILHKDGGVVEGLTTAAGLWTVASIGMAVGVGWYWQSVIATGLMFLVLFVDKKK